MPPVGWAPVQLTRTSWRSRRLVVVLTDSVDVAGVDHVVLAVLEVVAGDRLGRREGRQSTRCWRVAAESAPRAPPMTTTAPARSTATPGAPVTVGPCAAWRTGGPAAAAGPGPGAAARPSAARARRRWARTRDSGSSAETAATFSAPVADACSACPVTGSTAPAGGRRRGRRRVARAAAAARCPAASCRPSQPPEVGFLVPVSPLPVHGPAPALSQAGGLRRDLGQVVAGRLPGDERRVVAGRDVRVGQVDLRVGRLQHADLAEARPAPG